MQVKKQFLSTALLVCTVRKNMVRMRFIPILLIVVVVALAFTFCHRRVYFVNWRLPGFSLPEQTVVVEHWSDSCEQAARLRTTLTYDEFAAEMDQIMANIGFFRDPRSDEPSQAGYSIQYVQDPMTVLVSIGYVPNPSVVPGRGFYPVDKDWEYSIYICYQADGNPVGPHY